MQVSTTIINIPARGRLGNLFNNELGPELQHLMRMPFDRLVLLLLWEKLIWSNSRTIELAYDSLAS